MDTIVCGGKRINTVMRLDEIIRRNPLKLPPSRPSQPHLYHGTQLPNLALIIRSNTLYQGGYWHKPNEPHGVRCTRSLDAAKSFAFDQEIPGGILLLDWAKLAGRYRTIPHTDTRYNDDDPSQPGAAWGTDEAEEVVLVSAIKPLAPYLDGILMRAAELHQLRAGEFLQPDWLDGFSNWVGRPRYVHRRAVEALMAYPNITAIG